MRRIEALEIRAALYQRRPKTRCDAPRGLTVPLIDDHDEPPTGACPSTQHRVAHWCGVESIISAARDGLPSIKSAGADCQARLNIDRRACRLDTRHGG
jgi:hypothetical protein